MNANEIVSAVNERVQSILTEGLKNYFNEARLAIEAIEKEKEIGVNEYDKLWIILKSLKDIPGEMILELIRNSSLSDGDKCLLNILCGNPRVAILLTPTKTTKEEVYGDELPAGSKRAIQNELIEWPREEVELTDKD